MARPPTDPKHHRKNIALTLPPQLIERARIFGDVAGWSVSSMVETALTNYLNALDREIGKRATEYCKENQPSWTPNKSRT